MSKSLKKKNHWTSKVHESVVDRNAEGELGFELKGGAENGQFPHLGEVRAGKVAYQCGKLVPEELLLEVNETPVAGLTTRDVLAVIKHCKDPIRFKCVKQGGIVDKDLRHYLNLRFQKGSMDHELQQIIRDNLYLRTVPCHTCKGNRAFGRAGHFHQCVTPKHQYRLLLNVQISFTCWRIAKVWKTASLFLASLGPVQEASLQFL